MYNILQQQYTSVRAYVGEEVNCEVLVPRSPTQKKTIYIALKFKENIKISILLYESSIQSYESYTMNVLSI
jgi:hypothetical protein